MRICGQNPRTNADATFQDPVSEQQRSVHLISSHYDVTKVVILCIEYRYRSLSSIEVSSIDVIAGIVLTLVLLALNGLNYRRRGPLVIVKSW